MTSRGAREGPGIKPPTTSASVALTGACLPRTLGRSASCSSTSDRRHYVCSPRISASKLAVKPQHVASSHRKVLGIIGRVTQSCSTWLVPLRLSPIRNAAAVMVLPAHPHRYSTRPNTAIDKKDASKSGGPFLAEGPSVKCRACPATPAWLEECPTTHLVWQVLEASCIWLPMFWCALGTAAHFPPPA